MILSGTEGDFQKTLKYDQVVSRLVHVLVLKVGLKDIFDLFLHFPVLCYLEWKH